MSSVFALEFGALGGVVLLLMIGLMVAWSVKIGVEGRRVGNEIRFGKAFRRNLYVLVPTVLFVAIKMIVESL